MKIVANAAAVGFGGAMPVARRTLSKWKARRRGLVGYPRLDPFKTREEVEEYLSGDKIVCLLCGRALKSLGLHLRKIHDFTVDDYKLRYGLPWRRGLTCAETHIAYTDATLGQAGMLDRLAKLRSAPGARARLRSGVEAMRAPPPFLTAEHIKRCLTMCGEKFERQYTSDDAEEVLRRISTGRTLQEVLSDDGMPKSTWWHAYCRENPAVKARFTKIWDALPFDVQARGQRMGLRFVSALKALFDAGMSDHVAAEKLGVTAMTCNRHTKRWRASSRFKTAP